MGGAYKQTNKQKKHVYYVCIYVCIANTKRPLICGECADTKITALNSTCCCYLSCCAYIVCIYIHTYLHKYAFASLLAHNALRSAYLYLYLHLLSTNHFIANELLWILLWNDLWQAHHFSLISKADSNELTNQC